MAVGRMDSPLFDRPGKSTGFSAGGEIALYSYSMR
jgi:hypothetical protein